MKKSLIVATLAVLLSVNVLTPITYATGDLSENGSGMSENGNGMSENGSDNFGDLEGNSDSNSDGDENGSDDVGNPAGDQGDDSSQQGGDDLTGDDTTGSDNNQRDDQSSTDDAEILPGEGEGDVDPADPQVALPLAQPMPAIAPAPLMNTAPSPVQNVTLVDGQTFNSILETLAGDLSNITAIAKGTESDMQAATITEDISATGDGSIVAWYDNGTLYYYTSGNVVMNSNSSSMFKNCSNLTDISVLSTWDTSNVTSLYDFFNGCSSLSDFSSVENWDISNVTDMRSIFYGVGAEDLDLSNWNTSSATQMNNMFQACSNLTDIDLSGWDTSNVTNMRYMFAQTPKLSELNLGSFDTSNVTDMVGMFFIPSGTTPSLTTIYVSDKFVINPAADTDMMFKRQKNLVGQDGYKCSGNCEGSDTNGNAYIDNEYTPGYFTVAPDMVSVVLNHDPNTPGSLVEVKTIAKGGSISEPAISDKDGYTTLGWYDLDTDQEFISRDVINKNVTLYAKYQASVDYATFVVGSTFKNRLASLAGSASNVKKIVRADKLNNNANIEKVSTDDSLPVWAWYENGTVYYYSEVEKIYLDSDSSNMFNGFSNLESIDMSGWDTSRVTTMQQMFDGCTKLKELDLSGWDVSNVTSMHTMFKDCQNLTKIKGIESFNLNVEDGKTINMYGMFFNCYSIVELDLSGWDTKNVNRMRQMFQDCSSLKTIYASDKFVTNKLTDSGSSENMFNRTTNLVGGNATTYDSSKKDKTYARIDKERQPGYFTDRSLYAKVTFMDEGKEITSQLTKKGTLLTEPTLQERLNKKVTWYKDPGLTDSWDIDNDDIESDIRLYAKWSCIDEAIEKNGVCVLKAAEDQRAAQTVQDLELYFVDGSSNVTHYTIMDRNMGADEEFNQDVFSQNTESFGYYYQWGNNYGFSYEDAESRNIPTTSTKVPYNVWVEGKNSNYSSDMFVTVSEYDDEDYNLPVSWQNGTDDQLKNSNLWGDKTNTVEARQGPCPDGYYVPSVHDWTAVLSSWKGAVVDEFAYDQYASHLLLPLAGDVKKEEAYHQNAKIGNYWSSSLNGTRWNAYRMKVDVDFRADSNERRATGHPVRCFKNNFDAAGVPSVFTVEPNEGETAVVAVDEGVIKTLEEPTRSGHTFLGRYTTPDFVSGRRVSLGDDISGERGLYARWKWNVKFVDTDGNELGSGWFVDGYLAADLETYAANNINKPDDVRCKYTLSRWNTPFVDVTADAVYTGEYNCTVQKYKVSFVDDDGTVLQAETEYEYGTSAEDILKPADPTKKGYNFKGWSPDIKDVTGDVTYTATYKKRGSNRSGGGKGGDSDPEPTHGSADDERPDEDIPQPEDNEEDDVHAWAYKNGLTIYADIKDARFDEPLTRAQMAKISSIFDTNFLGRTPDESKESECSNYPDIQKMKGDLHYFVVQSCELKNMGYHYDNERYIPKFMPYNGVSVAEASVILSRMAWGKKYIIGPEKWYQGHMYAVYEHVLIDDTSDPWRFITRREAFTALYRLDKLLKEKK